MGRSETPGDSDYFVEDSPYFADACDDEVPAHTVTVRGFALDKYEATVGRFRQFVTAYDAWRGSEYPRAGAGSHPTIEGSGWNSDWNRFLPSSSLELVASLSCYQDSSTWTELPGASESYAVNCVQWYVAMAFCIWDGGYLPTEAEWEYAAAGGSEERLYPWGSASPDATRANYATSAYAPFVEVGSTHAGAGRWGQMDLGGGLGEWALDEDDQDWYTSEAASGVDVCNLPTGDRRVTRGGSWRYAARDTRGVSRGGGPALLGHDYTGFRCAHPL